MITFAIPYYRNVRFLMEAVGSVLDQTRPDWELLVVDDAGPEPVEQVIGELRHPRIRAVRNATNLGLAGNWNECIRLSTTPWVTILHADDRLAPAYAEEVLAVAEQDAGLAAVFTDACVIGADGAPKRSLPDTVKRFASRPREDHDVAGDPGLAAILANNYIMCPTLCYRRDVAGAHPFDPRWGFVLDLDHTARLLLAGHRLRGIRTPLYEYRRHSANQTSALTASSERFEEEIRLYRELADIACNRGWTATARAARRRGMVRAHLALQMTADLAGRRLDAARRKARLLVSDVLRGSRT